MNKLITLTLLLFSLSTAADEVPAARDDCLKMEKKLIYELSNILHYQDVTKSEIDKLLKAVKANDFEAEKEMKERVDDAHQKEMAKLEEIGHLSTIVSSCKYLGYLE